MSFGTAVMTVKYRADYQAHYQLDAFYYWAKLKHADGKMELQGVDRYERRPAPSITKQEPVVSQQEIMRAVGEAFNRCLAAGQAPLPDECPPSPEIPPGRVQWRLASDPAVNAMCRFDATFGVFHVTGKYSLTARPQSMSEDYPMILDGAYDATVLLERDGPRVLKIDPT